MTRTKKRAIVCRMPFRPDLEKTPVLTYRARTALGFTQRQLADELDVSRRTVMRWEAGAACPGVDDLIAMAEAVHPLDASLAAELAAEGGSSLGAIAGGEEPPRMPSSITPPDDTPARAFPPVHLLMDSVVHVVVQALAQTQGQDPVAVAREMLRVAFARASALGITMEEANDALSPEPTPAAEAKSAPGEAALATAPADGA